MRLYPDTEAAIIEALSAKIEVARDRASMARRYLYNVDGSKSADHVRAIEFWETTEQRYEAAFKDFMANLSQDQKKARAAR